MSYYLKKAELVYKIWNGLAIAFVMTRKVICYHLYVQISKFLGKVGYNTENS